MKIPIDQQIEHFKHNMSQDMHDTSILATLQFCKLYMPEIKQFIAAKNSGKQPDTATAKQDEIHKISKATTHACTLLNDPDFQSFLYQYAGRNLEAREIQSLPLDTDQDYHPAILRKILKIKSRKQISQDTEAFKRWRKLFDTFIATQNYSEHRR